MAKKVVESKETTKVVESKENKKVESKSDKKVTDKKKGNKKSETAEEIAPVVETVVEEEKMTMPELEQQLEYEGVKTESEETEIKNDDSEQPAEETEIKNEDSEIKSDKVETPDVSNEIKNEIERIIINHKFQAKSNGSGVTYFGESGRILKVIDSKKGLKIEFNSAISQMDGVTILTENEASEKHMGTCRWIYVGNDINIIAGLIEECIENYKAKPKKEKKVTKVKEDKPKVEKAKEKEFTNEPIVVSKNMPEEKKQLLRDIGREIQESEEF